MFALGIVVRTLVTLLSTTAAGANDHHEQPLPLSYTELFFSFKVTSIADNIPYHLTEAK